MNNPSRWLVLDFSGGTSACPGLDTALAAYVGRSPNAAVLLNTDPCIDHVAARIFVDNAFHPTMTETAAHIIIDGADLVVSKQGVARTQYNEKYRLTFTGGLTIIRNANGSVTLTNAGAGDDSTAELRTASGTLIGTFAMPFTVTLTSP